MGVDMLDSARSRKNGHRVHPLSGMREGLPQGRAKIIRKLEAVFMDNREWFKQAKYGMMAHWGLYSLLAGEYRGQPSSEYRGMDSIVFPHPQRGIWRAGPCF